ncbi:hypothetical protein LCGC14_0882600 [marine sediment metagenome]|uniref:Uncharacterized protein n=1 Tax=marine sediment metagenome TaxID=412755 RepID=A0A0F9PM03_9ZZZZ
MIDLDELYLLRKAPKSEIYECKVCIDPHTFVTINNFPCAFEKWCCACRPTVKIEKLNQWSILIPDWSDMEDPTFLVQHQHSSPIISHYKNISMLV